MPRDDKTERVIRSPFQNVNFQGIDDADPAVLKLNFECAKGFNIGSIKDKIGDLTLVSDTDPEDLVLQFWANLTETKINEYIAAGCLIMKFDFVGELENGQSFNFIHTHEYTDNNQRPKLLSICLRRVKQNPTRRNKVDLLKKRQN